MNKLYTIVLGVFVFILSIFSNSVAEIPLERTPCWVSDNILQCPFGISWGDVNGDGWLDLAIGDNQISPQPQRVMVYMNLGGKLETTPSWLSDWAEPFMDVAFGDVDNDGDLDLAVSNISLFGKNQVYYNNNGGLETTPSWVAASGGGYWCAWGDMNGDGWLDLACGDIFQYPYVYLNRKGILDSFPSWSGLDYMDDLGGGWADVDNDGDLDLGVSNPYGVERNRVYINQDTILETIASQVLDPRYTHWGMDWGDVNNDGWFDYAGGWGFGFDYCAIHMNKMGTIEPTPSWISSCSSSVFLTFGDTNGDDWIDLAAAVLVGNTAGMGVFENTNGTLESMPSWTSSGSSGYLPAWGDVDNDGLISAVDTLSGDGKRGLFYISHYPPHSIDSIKVDGAIVPRDRYCYDPNSYWVSLHNKPQVGENNILIYYTYSIDPDLAVAGEHTVLYRNTNVGIKEVHSSEFKVQSLQIYPNPFSHSAVISYQLPTKSSVSLNVYDISGRLVDALLDCPEEAGYHSITWNAEGVVGGIYFLKLEAQGKVTTKKVVLVK